MLSLFKRLILSITLCLAAAGLGTSSARCDELPGEALRDGAGATKIVDPSTSETTTADNPPRQHVRHLRAHKKIVSDTPSGPALATDGLANSPVSGTKPMQADANEKVAGGSVASSLAPKAGAKPRMKITRPRKESLEKTAPSENGVSRPKQQRDFFSDIFGSDN